MFSQISSSSPVDKVASNDDLLMEILSRLPVKSILRFMSVSKHMYFLVTSSFKLVRIMNPNRPSGMFVPIQTNKPFVECELIAFAIENPVKAPLRTLDFDPSVKRIEIEHSCNGLMLCSSQTTDAIEANGFKVTYKYYIYNPTINQFITLPRLENCYKSYRLGMTIAFDPLKSPHYSIIFVYYLCTVSTGYFPDETYYRIEVFSSQTCTYKVACEFPYDEHVSLDFRAGVYWNNAIHWIQKLGFLLYFNLDKESIHEIETPHEPLIPDDENWGSFCISNLSSYIFESRGKLLLVEILSPYNSDFKIHELARDYSAWSLKYHVDLDVVSWSYPEIFTDPSFPIEFEFVVLSIVLGENDDDSFLVLQIPGKVLRFNLVSETFHTLHDFTASSSSNDNGQMSISSWSLLMAFNKLVMR